MATNDPLDDYIDAVSRTMQLPVEDGWKAAVKANLDVTLKFARFIEEFPLPDDIEPASIYEA